MLYLTSPSTPLSEYLCPSVPTIDKDCCIKDRRILLCVLRSYANSKCNFPVRRDHTHRALHGSRCPGCASRFVNS